MEKPIYFDKDRCEVLTLVLKKKWYDMIASGEKNEEYRTSENICAQIERWFARGRIMCSYVANDNYSLRKHLVVKFCLGYGKNRPTFMRHSFGVKKRCYSLYPELGEPKEPHLVIELGFPVEFES